MTTEELMKEVKSILADINAGLPAAEKGPVGQAMSSVFQQGPPELAPYYKWALKKAQVVLLNKYIHIPLQTTDEILRDISSFSDDYYKAFGLDLEDYMDGSYVDSIRGCKYLGADYCEGFILSTATSAGIIPVDHSWNLLDMEYVQTSPEPASIQPEYVGILTLVLDKDEAIRFWEHLYNLQKEYAKEYLKPGKQIPEDKQWDGSLSYAHYYLEQKNRKA